MAAVRSFWKGHLRLALVSIPIKLVSARSSEDKIALHQVDRKSNQRIRYQKVAADTGKPVADEDIVSGYKIDDGSYVLLERDELDALKLNTRHTLELVQFVEACSIDPLYFDNPYYVLPDGDVAEEGYTIIRDALRDGKRVGVGQITMRGRENLIALKPCGNGMLLETLRYESEIREAESIFSEIDSTKNKGELIKMARQLIDERSKEFDASEFKNHYAEAIRDLVKTKVKGGETTDVGGDYDTAPGATVVDFMEALKRSTGQSKSASRKRSSTRQTKTAAAAKKTAKKTSKRKTSKSSSRRKAS